MKKILLLFLCFVLIKNVNAQTKYTEFYFDKYSLQIGEENELIKYESVKINKFYELIETNITYREQSTLNENELIDINDYREQKTYIKNRQYRYINYFVNTIKLEEDIFASKITLENFDSKNSYIREIEIKNNKSAYKIEEYDFLTDSNKDTGNKLNNVNIIINFEEPELINELEILFTVASRNGEDLTFNLNIDDKTINDIHYNMTYSENKNCILNFATTNELENILINNDIYTKDELNFNEKFSYIYYSTKLYKHYYLEKNYIIESDLKTIDGLLFDEEESYMGYKVYKREKLQEKVPQNRNVKYKALGTIMFEEENIELENNEEEIYSLKENVKSDIKKNSHNISLIVILILISIVNILIFIL